MRFDELLKAFGEKLGGNMELTPDESGAVALDIDGMPLTILGLEEVGRVALVGVIGEPPPEEKMERLYRAMLEANHNFAGTAGATLSINPDTGKVSLCRMLPLELMDGEKFFSETEHFVNTLEMWRKLVEDFRGADLSAPRGEGASGMVAAGADTADAAEPAGSFGMGDAGGFMRV